MLGRDGSQRHQLLPDQRHHKEQNRGQHAEKEYKSQIDGGLLRYAPADKALNQSLQEKRQHQTGEHRRQHAAESEQQDKTNHQEHHQIDGFLIGKVAVDPTTDDLQKAHGLCVFFPQQVDEFILLPCELEQCVPALGGKGLEIPLRAGICGDHPQQRTRIELVQGFFCLEQRHWTFQPFDVQHGNLRAGFTNIGAGGLISSIYGVFRVIHAIATGYLVVCP